MVIPYGPPVRMDEEYDLVTFEIFVEVKRGYHHATALYSFPLKNGKPGKLRSITDGDSTAQRAIKRVLSRLRRNGHSGKPYRASVAATGAVLAGIVPHPRSKPEPRPEAPKLSVFA